MNRRVSACFTAGVFAWVMGASAQSPTGSTASLNVLTGPHKGEYNFTPDAPCIITSFGKQPIGISVVLHAADSSLSIDMPSIEDKHANEIQIVLVIAEGMSADGASAPRKGASSVTYEIDTRPDAMLEPFQRAERANKGTSGKITTTLMQKADSALLSFTGTTASGVKIDGSVTCRKMIQGAAPVSRQQGQPSLHSSS